MDAQAAVLRQTPFGTLTGSLALLSAPDPTRPDDYYLFVANDHDFATTDGFHAGGGYNDAMFLAYRVTIGAVPEPASALLLLGGAAGLAALSRRRRT